MNTTSVVLKEGSRGAEVTKLQEGLKKLNFYSGIVDGVFGAKTKEAVINFQISQQLVADGIFGEKTWSKLNAALQQSNPRADFRVINVQEFISSNRIRVSTPKAIAVQLFSKSEEEEARKSEDISVAYLTRETAVIVYTIIGLGDDSVAGMRNRIELKRNQNKWEIVWVGEQYKCQPNRGHQDWSGSLCS
ncbi:peptidoglycan-binding domain-containing protein [Scytonema sp. PCC 10023]|uniref:peptidoglycan-binding domain-containing protein n=1 Tax=Scytonema sp. PCC 10023 TaxID=1680591 RepID=UPI0039C66F54